MADHNGTIVWQELLASRIDKQGAQIVLRRTASGEFVTHYHRDGVYYAAQYAGWELSGLKNALDKYEQRITRELRYAE